MALDLVEGTSGAVADPGFSRERDAVAEGTESEAAVGCAERDGSVNSSDHGRWEGGNELRADPVREGSIARRWVKASARQFSGREVAHWLAGGWRGDEM